MVVVYAWNPSTQDKFNVILSYSGFRPNLAYKKPYLKKDKVTRSVGFCPQQWIDAVIWCWYKAQLTAQRRNLFNLIYS